MKVRAVCVCARARARACVYVCACPMGVCRKLSNEGSYAPISPERRLAVRNERYGMAAESCNCINVPVLESSRDNLGGGASSDRSQVPAFSAVHIA